MLQVTGLRKGSTASPRCKPVVFILQVFQILTFSIGMEVIELTANELALIIEIRCYCRLGVTIDIYVGVSEPLFQLSRNPFVQQPCQHLCEFWVSLGAMGE